MRTSSTIMGMMLANGYTFMAIVRYIGFQPTSRS